MSLPPCHRTRFHATLQRVFRRLDGDGDGELTLGEQRKDGLRRRVYEGFAAPEARLAPRVPVHV